MTDAKTSETVDEQWSIDSPECPECGSHDSECIVVQCRDRAIVGEGDIVRDKFSSEGMLLQARCMECDVLLFRSDALDVLSERSDMGLI